MKTKFLIAAAVAATLSPMAAQAQTRELNRDRADIREEQRELRQAKRYGDRGDIREERRDVREAKREYREDRRDWRDDRHRAARFDAPFRYRSFNNGVRISAGYYAPRYYVNNYGAYRLPAPHRNQRYVRHYNDLLLVNVRSGHVVRVHRNYFW